MLPELPAGVAGLLSCLWDHGFDAYAVGGCVRDSLLGRIPNDWDVCTSARPEQVKSAVRGIRTLDTGLRHGTVSVLLAEGPVEVTTFRRDGLYSDHRRPDSVAFTDSVLEDLARRDFTVNAMAFDGTHLLDPFGGQQDLKAGLLRAVGKPECRFQEDALRILRALRFSSQLGFSLEKDTSLAVLRQQVTLNRVSPERVREELCKLLCGDCTPVLRAYASVISVVIPEIAPMFGFDQHNRHHLYDVWEHTLHALAASSPDRMIRLALLLHDCGKPGTFSRDGKGEGHFYGHARKSASLADNAFRRLRFDNETRMRSVRLIALHDHDLPPTVGAVRHWLLRLPPEDLRRLILLKRADNTAQCPEYSREEEWNEAERCLKGILDRHDCVCLAQLAVNGRDLMALGLRGKEVGNALRFLLEAVMSGEPNTKNTLVALLTERLCGKDGSESL